MASKNDAHYAAVAAHYSRALFYSEGPYRWWQLGMLTSTIGEGRRKLADVGGGNGQFGRDLAALTGGDVTLVEPSAAMVGDAPAYIGGAHDWASTDDDDDYDVVLLKEVAHHLEDRVALYRKLRTRKMAKDGVLVIVTRPRHDIDYPFFDAAKKVWAANQPNEATLADELRSAGFPIVETHRKAYPLELPSLHEWIAMIRDRFWSTFAAMDDETLEAGIAELESKTPTRSPLRFEERLVILVARTTDSAVETTRSMIPPVTMATRGFSDATDVVDGSSAAKVLSAIDEHAGGDCASLKGDDRYKLHLLLPEVAELVRSPLLVKTVSSILGTPDVLIWSTDLVCKEPHSSGHFTPHQDSAYAGLCPADQALSAWIALTPATTENGCLRYYPGSHLRGHLPHVEGDDSDNLLAFAQRITNVEDLGPDIPVPLDPGRACLHMMRTVHWSPPNSTALRRVGFVVRFVAASIQRLATHRRARETATLVAGHYTPSRGAFDLEPRPTSRSGPAERDAHANAMRLKAMNYFGGRHSSSAAYK